MTAAQEIVREVGISHCNNVRSLIDHAHVADSTHYIVDTLRKELLSLLWDLNYYLTKDERDHICVVFDNIQASCSDIHFQESVNNYHKHHFDINHQMETKGLRSWATDGIAITHMYKQLVMESKRVPTKQTETYIKELVANFVREINNHNQKFLDLFEKHKKRNAGYNPITTPLLPVEVEDYVPKKDIVAPRTKPTWLTLKGDRPNHMLGLPKPDEPLPTGNQESFQGGRNLYERAFNERKTALNMPKYTYKVEQLEAQRQERRAQIAKDRLAMPQRR